jgi:hypothetical protein
MNDLGEVVVTRAGGVAAGVCRIRAAGAVLGEAALRSFRGHGSAACHRTEHGDRNGEVTDEKARARHFHPSGSMLVAVSVAEVASSFVASTTI